MSIVSNIPLLDVSNGFDPSNIQWRTNKVLSSCLEARYNDMIKFMKTIHLKRLSTYIVVNEIKYKVLIDLNKPVN